MAKTRKFKEELVKIYREKISNSKSVFIIKPSGITANESVQIKKDLINVGSSYNVVKNSIFSIALEQEGSRILKQKNMQLFSLMKMFQKQRKL